MLRFRPNDLPRRIRLAATQRLWAVGASTLILLSATTVGIVSPNLSPSAGAAQTPFVVDVNTGLTGFLGVYGQSQKGGFEASAKVINENGGIDHHRVVVHFFDDQANPATDVSLVHQELTSGTRPNLVYLGSSSEEALATVPITAAAKVLSLTSAAAANVDNPHKYPYNFSDSNSPSGPYVALGQYLKSKHYSNLAILTSADAFGSSENGAAVSQLDKLGIKHETASYDDTAINYTPQLEQLRADNPDALYFVGFGAGAGYFFSDVHTLGWKVPIIGSPAAASENLASVVPAGELNTTVLDVYKIQQYLPASKRSAAFKTFLSAVNAEGPITIPIYSPSLVYDGLQLIALAANQAQSIAPAKIAYALEHLKQPANKPYVTFAVEGFSPSLHSIHATPGDFVFLRVGKLVDGMFKSPGS